VTVPSAVGVTVKEYVVPEPESPETVPLPTVMSEAMKPVTLSENVAVTENAPATVLAAADDSTTVGAAAVEGDRMRVGARDVSGRILELHADRLHAVAARDGERGGRRERRRGRHGDPRGCRAVGPLGDAVGGDCGVVGRRECER